MAIEPEVAPRLATGGDDYELLFTAAAEVAEVVRGIASRLGVPVTKIGRIEAGQGVRLVDAAGSDVAVAAAGYRHF